MDDKKNSEIVDLEHLKTLRAQWKTENKTVVWTNGCFDILHVGHLQSVQAAKALGDILVVGVNSDRSVQSIKGKNRPIMGQSERAELMAALKPVDFVIIFDDSTPENTLKEVQPDIHCKGSDYAPPHGKPVPEASLVEDYGGEIHYLPLIDKLSTTNVVEKIRSQG